MWWGSESPEEPPNPEPPEWMVSSAQEVELGLPKCPTLPKCPWPSFQNKFAPPSCPRHSFMNEFAPLRHPGSSIIYYISCYYFLVFFLNFRFPRKEEVPLTENVSNPGGRDMKKMWQDWNWTAWITTQFRTARLNGVLSTRGQFCTVKMTPTAKMPATLVSEQVCTAKLSASLVLEQFCNTELYSIFLVINISYRFSILPPPRNKGVLNPLVVHSSLNDVHITYGGNHNKFHLNN